MIDRLILPLQHRLLAPPARALAAAGISADALTLAGFGLGLGAVGLIAAGHSGVGLVALAANRLADGLDGAVARITGPTDRGAFLDIALDFAIYALVPLGFALADPARAALPAAVLVVAFVGTGSSFLAYAAVAARRGDRPGPATGKGIHYLGGLTEGAETIAVFAAMALWPALFPALAYGFAGLCLITTLTRWWQGWVTFTRPAPPPG